ncbi:hypothetical protein HY490_05920 [Candidatus Woesearchaeota archaeon]|nr:hypothetical protein [Candidatus Woesearchaeota archaeon]
MPPEGVEPFLQGYAPEGLTADEQQRICVYTPIFLLRKLGFLEQCLRKKGLSALQTEKLSACKTKYLEMLFKLSMD